MTQQLILTRGAPGSGKTTWAVQKTKKDSNFVNVNRDDLRAMLFPAHYGNGVYKPSRARENMVTGAQRAAVHAALDAEQSVIISDTNLKHRGYWEDLAKARQVEYRIKDFYEDLDVLLERNAKRDGGVPPSVVHRMYYEHVSQLFPHWRAESDNSLPSAIIVDVDGTLANHEGVRSPYDASKVHLDKPHLDIIDLVQRFRGDHHVIIMTGRDGSAADATAQWLEDNHVDFDELHIRAEGDTRKDSVIKKELFDKHVRGKYNVKYVIDDRLQVIYMWRALGLRVLDVSGGTF